MGKNRKLRVGGEKVFRFHSVHYLHKFECAVFEILNSVTACISKIIVKMMDLNGFYNWEKNVLETTEKSRFFFEY